jgi:hypothetical protein
MQIQYRLNIIGNFIVGKLGYSLKNVELCFRTVFRKYKFIEKLPTIILNEIITDTDIKGFSNANLVLIFKQTYSPA